jgi:hypothetical protein
MSHTTRAGDAERAAVLAVAAELDREPWEPIRFKAGDRVRIKVSLECRYCLDPRFPKCYANALADDGRTATVYDVGHDDCSCRWDDDDPPDAAHLGHDVWVTWDERRSYDEPELEAVPFDAHFAASELVPLELQPADTRGDEEA